MKTKSSHLSDYLVALSVIGCTLALLAGLAMALTGYRWHKSGRTLHVDFPDVAGIHQHSPVRYAGAPAGSVTGMRHLTTAERLGGANPKNAVRVTLSLHDEVPPIPDDVVAALGADTLLSEKFIALSAGTAGGGLLADGAVIQGLPQPTFDDLIRVAGDLVHMLDDVLPAVKTQVQELLPKIAAISDTGRKLADDGKVLVGKAGTLLDNLTALTGSGKELAGDAQALVRQATKLIENNEASLDRTLKELPGVLDNLDALLGRTQGLLSVNEKDLSATIRDLRAVMQDMRVVTVHAKTLTATLAAGRPTRLIWTNDANPPPADAEKKPQPPPRKVPGRP